MSRTAGSGAGPRATLPARRIGRLASGHESKRQPRVDRVHLDCLFPMEQEATGINSTAPTASLTGRIWFFCCCFPLDRYSPTDRPTDCERPSPFASVPERADPRTCGADPSRSSQHGYEPRARMRPLALRRALIIRAWRPRDRGRCQPSRGLAIAPESHSPSGTPRVTDSRVRCFVRPAPAERRIRPLVLAPAMPVS